MKQRVAAARMQHELYHEVREVREEINYDREEMEGLLNQAVNGAGAEKKGKFTPSQNLVYEAIKNALQGTGSKQIYINARGGSGKTFLLNRLLYCVRTLDVDAIGLAVAVTGIAAQLLQGVAHLIPDLSFL